MIQRTWLTRNWTLALSALAFASILPAAHAETECQPYGNRTVCVVGLLSDEVDEQFAGGDAQERTFWCWAASVSMIFRRYGYDVSQQQIVLQTFGSARNAPAYGPQITSQLNRSYKTSDGRSFKVSATVSDMSTGQFQVNNSKIIESLEQGRPLLIGAQGHAMVLTAVKYIRNPSTGRPGNIIGAIVRDPWPGRGKRELSLGELSPIYLANVNIEGTNVDRVDLQRQNSCLDGCFSQSNSCMDAVQQEEERCTQNADRICDRCRYLSGSAGDRCDRQCERATETCDRHDKRKQDTCTTNYDRCMNQCK